MTLGQKIVNDFHNQFLHLHLADEPEFEDLAEMIDKEINKKIEELKLNQADNFYVDDKGNWQNRAEEADLNKE